MALSYYEVLGVAEDATPAEIRAAYKRLALKHHPDKVPAEERPAAEVRFKDISQAYEVLSDEQERANYDYGASAEAQGFENFFSNMYNGGFDYDDHYDHHNYRPSSKSPDSVHQLDLTLEDLYKGKVFRLATERVAFCTRCEGSRMRSGGIADKCTQCNGVGVIRVERSAGMGMTIMTGVEQCPKCLGTKTTVRDRFKCPRCKGSGTRVEKTLREVYIPPGAPDGFRVVFENMADAAPGKTTGDLIFTVTEKSHTVFKRINSVDLAATVKVSLADALCGFSRVLVEHLDGRGIRITTPPGTVVTPGQVFKIANEGMPKNGSLDRHGDLYLKMEVQFPQSGWTREKNDFQRLRTLLPSVENEEVNMTPNNISDVTHEVQSEVPGQADASSRQPGIPDNGMPDNGMPGCQTQ